MFKKALQQINKFYEPEFKSPEQIQQVFEILNEVIRFDCCAIFYLVPNQLQLKYHSGHNFNQIYEVNDTLTRILYNTENENFSEELNKIFSCPQYTTAARLVVKGTVLGIIFASRQSTPYNEDEKVIFNTYANVIANIIKDIELTNILSQQTKTLAKGIEETRNAYETIKQQNLQIKKNEKLQNRFLANISHDLRTPLNSIISFSEILSSNIFGELNPKQQEYIEDIRIAGIRLLGMINEVLDITKIESHTIKLNITNIDIPILVNEVCNILKPIYTKKGIKICLNIPQNLMISGDYIKLQQVLFNITGNAIKFSPKNSIIEINAAQNDKYIAISVKDSGIGIAKSNQKKIFKKFYQVENTLSKSEISTGLGLTIAKEFVKLHKGDITVHSELQKGAEFIIKLPAVND